MSINQVLAGMIAVADVAREEVLQCLILTSFNSSSNLYFLGSNCRARIEAQEY